MEGSLDPRPKSAVKLGESPNENRETGQIGQRSLAGPGKPGEHSFNSLSSLRKLRICQGQTHLDWAN